MRTALLSQTLALAVVVAACGGGASVPSGSAWGGEATRTLAPATGMPVTDGPSGEPAVEAATTTGVPATDAPASEVTEAPETEPPATPDASAATGGAEACSGSDENRSFFAAAADAVAWPVLCAVLPKGWFVSEGSYRQADGGKLLVSYKGPGGATLSISEGSFCATDDGCVPAGREVGDAALGSLAGTLVGLDDGGFAIVVDRGLRPSWLMVTQGPDQATTLALGSALVEVGD